jgi:hypothetical protein
MGKKIKMTFVLFLLATACRKDQPIETTPTTTRGERNSLTVDEARKWIGTQNVESAHSTQSTRLKFDLGRLDIAWDKVQSVKTDTGTYLLAHLSGQPTFQNVKQGYRKLLFKRDATGKIEALLLDIIPDALYIQRAGTVNPSTFTGRVFIYDRNYQFKNGQVFVNGKQMGAMKPQNKATESTSPTDIHIDLVQVIKNCIWSDSYYINGNGEVVIYSEQICSYDIIDSGGGGGSGVGNSGPVYTGVGGGGGGTSATTPSVSNLPGETNPAINPKSYMDCFSNLPDIGSKMTITVYVQEPAPGLPFNVGQNSVGHTAVGLTKTYNGQTVQQVVGFYPDATGKDKMHAPSKILDNSDLKYTVSISYSVIASEFNKIAAFIGNPPSTYDISNYNCTNFAYNACKAGGITLPNPVGNIGMAQTGMTPAALGNSLRNVAPDKNINTSEGRIPETKGPCK